MVGSFTEQDSDGQDPSELRGAGFAEAELPPLKPLLPPELTSASASSASFFFFAITASCFCCSRTSASMATLACCGLLPGLGEVTQPLAVPLGHQVEVAARVAGTPPAMRC